MKSILLLVGGKGAPSAKITRAELDIPCMTGVPYGTSLIRTGERPTVVSYLGIVTVAAAPEQ